MKVVILCGGLGTRMREETEFRPKPMVEVGGRPVLWHIMKLCAAHGLNEFVLCLGYRGAVIKEYFLNYEAMNNDFSITLGRGHVIDFHDMHEEQDFRVTLADTGQLTMTGGRVKRVERFIDGDLFMVTYGDTLADVNLRELVAFHRRHGKLATVTAVHPVSRFGILDLNDERSVTRFIEKPQSEGWANAGFFVFSRGALDYFSADESCIMERQPLERLAADGQLMACCHEGFFFAMDTYREYQQLNEMWAKGAAPWKVWK